MESGATPQNLNSVLGVSVLCYGKETIVYESETSGLA